MKIVGKLTISRNNQDEIVIRITDDASRTQFVKASLDPHSYAMLITGLSEVEAECEVNNLDRVGKQKIIERRSIECPLNTYSKDELKAWLLENAQEEGWMLDTYLGSQDSVGCSTNGGRILRYHVFKFIELGASGQEVEA